MVAGIKLAVNGTLMQGLALNPNLLKAGASFLYAAATTPDYRLWSVGDRPPAMLGNPFSARGSEY